MMTVIVPVSSSIAVFLAHAMLLVILRLLICPSLSIAYTIGPENIPLRPKSLYLNRFVLPVNANCFVYVI
ncbi:MAG: hypothetical protein LUG24_10020 [Clostridiales bacterium]|nr:hypothetical protein [Clostridiales bacterium]